MEYIKYSDETLAELAKNSDDKAMRTLMDRYEDTIRYEISSFFIKGGDSEDLYQEGMIGLYNAIRDFKPDKNATFRTFARLVIARHILTAVEKASRKKHEPLNTYVSIFEPEVLGSEGRIIDSLTSDGDNPLKSVIDSEAFDDYNNRIKKALTPLELIVLKYYLEGKKYSEISSEIKRDVKSVDNAIQRIRKKLEWI